MKLRDKLSHSAIAKVTGPSRTTVKKWRNAPGDNAHQGLITVLPDYTVRVSPTLKTKSADAFLQESLLRFDKTPIRMPSRLAPAPNFLAWHARHFGFI